MKYLLSLIMLFSSMAFAADPTLKITPNATTLFSGQSTGVTFTFSEPVTGFDITDIHVRGNATLSGFTGSGSSYFVSVQKTVDRNSFSLVVDNNATLPTGHGATVGFNASPRVYIKENATFLGRLVEAVPQPSCPLVGEILVNADNTAAAPLNEKYFVLGKGRRALTPQELKIDCLTRVLTGQKYVKTIAPKVHELNNQHGALNHSNSTVKVTQAYIQPLAGTTKLRVRPANECPPNANGILECRGILYNGVTVGEAQGEFRAGNVASKIDFDDPIVFPNQKGKAHAHTFFGNNGVNYQTNSASLLKGCSSLFAGGIANCTGYWMPSVVDTATNTALLPDGILIYYKSGGLGSVVQPVPKGLKIIAGSGNRKPSDPETDRIEIECFPRVGSGLSILNSGANKTIPACSGDKYEFIRFTVLFPNCVADDGTGKMALDSPNHRSHLVPYTGAVYPLVNGKFNCPTAFPHHISTISQVADHTLSPGQNTATWRLSSDNYGSDLAGGASLHADWWGGWQDYWIARLVNQCNTRNFDCGVNYIGLNDGVGVSNVTTAADGLTAIITTNVPHRLQVSLANGDYPVGVGSGTKLLGKIVGFAGVSAASYNYDVNKMSSVNGTTGLKMEVPQGTQALKILNATQIEFPLNSIPATPINGAVDPAQVKVFWGETLCGIREPCASDDYVNFYYSNKN